MRTPTLRCAPQPDDIDNSSKSKPGSVALVTGGGRGIGRLAAEALADDGMAVGLIARSPAELDETVAVIESAGGRAAAVVADVTDEWALGTAITNLRRDLGPIDVLINNAGIIGPAGPVWEVDSDEWWRTMEVNLRGTLLPTQILLPDMVARRRGRIINISSHAGVFRWPLMSAYSVSKAAVVKLTENLARETVRHGISVFSVHPGLLPLGLSARAVANRSAPDPHVGHIDAWVRNELAAGRGADPDRAIKLIVDLASGRYDELTGRQLSVHDDVEELLERVDDVRDNELYVLGLQKLPAADERDAWHRVERSA